MLIFLFLISSLFAQAQKPSDVDIDRRLFMPRSLGLCGSMVARINLNESIYFNPASAAHSKSFSTEIGYAWNYSSELSKRRMDTYYVNAIDTDTDLFGGGVGYYKKKTKGGAGSEWEARGSINKLISKRLAFGLGISHLSYTYFNQASTNFNVDLGLLYLLGQKTILGATAFNLLGDDNNVRTRSIDIGARQAFWDFFAISLDMEHRFDKKINISGALELLYRNGMMINISARREQYTQTNFWGLGLGYVAPKLSIIYGTMNAINYPFSFTHSFSVRVFF
ncbi:MAG: hypothetical protein NTY22_02855 [Proteobacteria bacterium]|nr:hypothetical protein [Pseudomonadota bacterium]